MFRSVKNTILSVIVLGASVFGSSDPVFSAENKQLNRGKTPPSRIQIPYIYPAKVNGYHTIKDAKELGICLAVQEAYNQRNTGTNIDQHLKHTYIQYFARLKNELIGLAKHLTKACAKNPTQACYEMNASSNDNKVIIYYMATRKMLQHNPENKMGLAIKIVGYCGRVSGTISSAR